jgi:hypothetical protein
MASRGKGLVLLLTIWSEGLEQGNGTDWALFSPSLVACARAWSAARASVAARFSLYLLRYFLLYLLLVIVIERLHKTRDDVGDFR